MTAGSEVYKSQLLITGRFIDAETAVEYGLINQSVSNETLDQAVSDLANEIASKPEPAVRLGKRLFYQQVLTIVGKFQRRSSLRLQK